MLKKLCTIENLKQFISYFFVGGAAALVEWVAYFLFDNILHLFYMLATILAFFCSTTVNWILGRVTTFKEKQYEKKGKEAFLVFFVSGIGLLFNLFLMFLFVDKLHLFGLLSKILATGIVFVWNFLSRKFLIYKD